MFKSRSLTYLLVGGVVVALILAGCGGIPTPRPTEVLEEGGNPIPTPIVGVDVGEGASSQAAATPEETFERYVAASLGALVAQQKQKIELRQRYQNPDQTKEDLGGLLTKIDLLENRTKIKKVTDTSTNATANVDIDVRITWADGDTETRECKYAVTLQQAENEDGAAVWYVINPDSFPAFISCREK